MPDILTLAIVVIVLVAAYFIISKFVPIPAIFLQIVGIVIGAVLAIWAIKALMPLVS